MLRVVCMDRPFQSQCFLDSKTEVRIWSFIIRFMSAIQPGRMEDGYFFPVQLTGEADPVLARPLGPHKHWLTVLENNVDHL